VIQPLFEHRLTLAGFNTRVLELEGDGLPIAMFHERVLETVPDTRLELLPGVGHGPQIEAFGRFTELLLRFGDEREAAAAAA
jgi:hypothetical protein